MTILCYIMGCKCKEKAKKIEKYSEEKIIVPVYGTDKIVAKIRQVIITFLTFILIIIISPILIFVLLYNTIIGKRTIINISNILKKYVRTK